MPTHWTYVDFDPADDLYQGDIHIRTPALNDVLAQVHAYFLDPKFVGFVILTQTCDLVRRSDGCKAEHVNIAVVRELMPMLPDLVGKIAGTGVPGLFRRSVPGSRGLRGPAAGDLRRGAGIRAAKSPEGPGLGQERQSAGPGHRAAHCL